MNLVLLMCSLAMVATGARQASPPLRELAAKRHLLIGSCARPEWLRAGEDGGKYSEVLAREFSLVEPENELKPPAIWQGIGKYDWTNPDFLLGAPGERGWAEEHNMKVRGHVLVYARDQGYTIPNWLLAQESTITPDQAKQILKDYITTVVGRYRHKIAMWDVVNEAIDDRPNTRPFNLRDSFWFRKLGQDFILLAFQFAHDADPSAELYYNEFSIENGGVKRDHTMDLLKWLKSQHAPITGLGLQCHFWAGEKIEPGDNHYKLVEDLAHERLAFMITELDVSVPTQPGPPAGLVPVSDADVQKQVDTYRAIITMARNSRNCHGIQIWGFTDKHSWIPQFQRGRGAALLFDANYMPKATYTAVSDALR